MGAKFPSFEGVTWNVGVGAHTERAALIRPLHEFGEDPGMRVRLGGVGFAKDDAAGRAVERNPVAFANGEGADAHHFALLVHLDFSAASHTAFTHAARYDGSVRRHSPARCKDANRHFHAVNVVRDGLAPHQNHRV